MRAFAYVRRRFKDVISFWTCQGSLQMCDGRTVMEVDVLKPSHVRPCDVPPRISAPHVADPRKISLVSITRERYLRWTRAPALPRPHGVVQCADSNAVCRINYFLVSAGRDKRRSRFTRRGAPSTRSPEEEEYQMSDRFFFIAGAREDTGIEAPVRRTEHGEGEGRVDRAR